MIIIVIPSVIGLMLTSRNVILIIAGKNYLQSTSSLRILSLALFFGTMNTILVECVLIPSKREKATLITAIVAAVINVALNFVLIPILSENGAAVTTVVAELSSMLINFRFSKDIIGKDLFNKEFLKNGLCAIFGGIGIALVCLLIGNTVSSNVTQLILSVIFSIAIYSLILWIFRNELFFDIVNKIKLFIK